jgi:hypothetical protein
MTEYIYRRVLGRPIANYTIPSGITDAPEFAQPVAAILGAELITSSDDADFTGGAGNWSGTNWAAGAGVYAHVAGANAATLSAYAPAIGLHYKVTMTVVTSTAGSLSISYGGTVSGDIGQITGTLTAYTVLLSASSTDYLTVTPNATWEGSIDDISIKVVTPSVPSVTINDPSSSPAIEIRPHSDAVIGAGLLSLSHNVSGDDCFGYGPMALFSNISGSNNEAFGNGALEKCTIGHDNFAHGEGALGECTVGYENIGILPWALGSLIYGYRNIASGLYSLGGLIGGYSNIAHGHNAGRYIAGGVVDNAICYESIFIGDDTRPNADGETNQIVIGHAVTGNGSNTLTIGNSSVTDTYLAGSVHNDSIVGQVLKEVVQDLSASTAMDFDIPSGASIIGIKFRVDAVITSGDGATDWRADLSGGSSETIVDSQALAQNTKPVWSGLVVCSAVTDMVISSDTGTISGGTLRATIRYTPKMEVYDDI